MLRMNDWFDRNDIAEDHPSYVGQVEVHSNRAATAFNGKIILLCSKCLNAHVHLDEREATCKSCGAGRSSLSGFILHLEDPDPSRATWAGQNTGNLQYPTISLEKIKRIINAVLND